MIRSLLVGFFVFALPLTAWGASPMETDTITTSEGDLVFTFVGHGSVMALFNGKVIHVDPFGKLADYTDLPDADLILITHEHMDHLDADAVKAIRKPDTVILANPAAAAKLPRAEALANGDSRAVLGLTVLAVPAYNVVHMRSEGVPYHPKGNGNGYVVKFSDKSVYFAGDTENIPEMADLKGIDIAFLPANLPYTMTPEMAADAALMIRPKIFYPYHLGETETERIVELLADHADIELRVRSMK